MNRIKTTIGELCLVGDGTHGKVKRQNSGIMYLSSKNFKANGLDLTKLDYISEEDFKKHFKEESKALTKPKKGDILMSIIGTMGMPYVVKESDKFGISSSVCIIRPSDELIPQYLYYWMLSDEFQKAVLNFKSGVAQGFLSLDTIRKLPLAYPSKKIQIKIVDIISKYDDLIENNLKRIKLLEESAELLYKEWFINLKFPGYEECCFVNNVPQDWEKVNLYDIADIKMGYAFKANDFNEDGIGKPAIRIRDIPNQTTKTYTTEEVDSDYIINKGDILIGMDGIFYNDIWAGEEGYLVQRVCRLRAKYEEYQGFLWQAIKQPINYYEKTITGATVAHLGAKHLKEIEILIPNKKYKLDIDMFNKFYKQKIKLLQQNAKLNEARDILIQKLITGEIEV